MFPYGFIPSFEVIKDKKALLRPEERCFSHPVGLTHHAGAQKTPWCRTYSPPKAESQNNNVTNPGHIARLLSCDVCSHVSNVLSICAVEIVGRPFLHFPGKTLVSRCPLRRRCVREAASYRPGGRRELRSTPCGPVAGLRGVVLTGTGARSRAGPKFFFLDFLKSSKENPVDRMKGNRDNVQFAQRQRGYFIYSVS